MTGAMGLVPTVEPVAAGMICLIESIDRLKAGLQYEEP